MYARWPFFRTLVDKLDMVLAKVDFGIASRYAGLVPDRKLRKAIFSRIEREHDDTRAAFFAITGAKALLASNPSLARSLRNRIPYIDPLNHLQVDLLRRLRSGKGTKATKTSFAGPCTSPSTAWRRGCATAVEERPQPRTIPEWGNGALISGRRNQELWRARRSRRDHHGWSKHRLLVPNRRHRRADDGRGPQLRQAHPESRARSVASLDADRAPVGGGQLANEP